MKNNRVYGYYPPVRRESYIYKAVDDTNKTLSRLGFAVGALGIGGYFLYKKLDNLAKDVKKLRETGK